MFKLTSGLAGSRVTIDLHEFLQQAGDLARAEAAPDVDQVRKDWFTTHPFSPLRVRALQLASEAPPYGSKRTADAVDLEVGDLLAVMEPRYTTEKSDAAEAMRRLLFAAGIAIAAASGGKLGDDERAALEKLLGPGGVPTEIDVASVREILAERIARVRDIVPPLRRHQVMRDLCVIARADGRTSRAEEAVLVEVADGIGLPHTVVASWLADACKPLD
jgi:tellurite resistance protein